MREWSSQHLGRTGSVVAALVLLGLAVSPASRAAAPGASPVSATASADPGASAKPKPKPPPLPPLAASYAPTSGDSCRLSCGRHYYFCLSGPDASQCPEQWTQCRSQCSAAPGLASPKP